MRKVSHDKVSADLLKNKWAADTKKFHKKYVTSDRYFKVVKSYWSDGPVLKAHVPKEIVALWNVFKSIPIQVFGSVLSPKMESSEIRLSILWPLSGEAFSGMQHCVILVNGHRLKTLLSNKRCLRSDTWAHPSVHNVHSTHFYPFLHILEAALYVPNILHWLLWDWIYMFY